MYDYDFRNPKKGEQNVSVLADNLIATLESSDPSFVQTARDLIARHGLKPGITVDCRNLSVAKGGAASVVIGTHQIELNETFLSYLWCIVYSLLVFYDTMLQPGEPMHRQKARDAFGYAMRLIQTFSPWPDQVPNPAFGMDVDRWHVEKTNAIFCYAANFVVLHEIGHVACGHTADRSTGTAPRWQRIEDERAADRWAWEHGFSTPVQRGVAQSRQFGGIAAILGLLLLNRDLVHESHPDSDERLRDALRVIEPSTHGRLLVLQGVRLWEQHYRRPLNWIAADCFEAMFESVFGDLARAREHDDNARLSGHI